MSGTLTELCQTCHNKRVLIVDDEVSILFSYRKLLEREGMKVDVCESFEEAVEHIRDNDYCAVIADIRLSGSENTDGLKILHEIKKKQPDAKVILMTGYGNSDIEQMAYDLGAAHYFEKPVRPSVILDTLKSRWSFSGSGSKPKRGRNVHEGLL
jgi:DNA-binding NtrC family response regulator